IKFYFSMNFNFFDHNFHAAMYLPTSYKFLASVRTIKFRSDLNRFLWSVWSCFALVITESYSRSLLSYMSVPVYESSITTIYSLAKAVKSNKFQVGFLESSLVQTIIELCI